MKVTNELINHLQAEIDKLIPLRPSSTKEDINLLIGDIDKLLDERMQLEKAKSKKKISKDELEVANGTLLLKQVYLGAVSITALSYLRDKLFKNAKRNKKSRPRYFVTLNRFPE